MSALSVSLAMAGVAHAGATGGQVTAGAGTVIHNGNTTTIVQSSQQLSLNWQSFDVGAGETVNFVQPGRSSVAINRVLGNTASGIFGNLNANGQVWLINPNGVLFGKGSQVHVGGLVATTLDTGDTASSSVTRTFSGNGKGSVINQGTISAGSGGYVALLGNQVSNQGTITARLGTVALGAGSAATLTFQGNRLLHVQVDHSTLNNLAENKQLIQADGGQVIMTAGAANALLASAVNNTGVVRAQTVENHNGTITLLGGMAAGEVNVGGTLDASAPHGGNGGQIETSAAYAHISGDAHITASAPGGKAGTWLVDPFDLTIDTAAATSIRNTLNTGTNVTEQTFASAAPSGSGVSTSGTGNINVNAPISWTNAASTLTLLAYNGINVNSVINGAGSVVMTASGANLTIGAGASITGGQGVTLGTAANFVNQSGAGAVAAGAGARWLVYSTNPTADARNGLAAAFTQYNAAAGTAALGTGNGFLYKVAPVVRVTGLSGTAEKDYDGNNAATIAGSNITSAGLINGDTVGTAVGTYGSTDAGTGLAVTSSLSAAAYTFADASSHPVYGYQIGGTPVTANIGVIDPKALTVSIVGTPTKTYDGSSTATLGSSNYVVGGLVGSQMISFGQPNSVSYAAPDAGAETVTANFVPSNFVASNGAKLSNYVLPTTGAGAGFINQAPVNLTGLLSSDKVYDGTTADALDTSHVGIYGVIAGDTGAVALDASAGTGNFATVNVGNNLGVTASGFVLTGSQAHNYLLEGPTDLVASITPRTLSIGGIIANSKVYDATRGAFLNVANATLNGLVVADQGAVNLSTSGQVATFGTANVGNGIGVTATGFSLTGTGLANYTLSQPAGLSANITPAPLTIAITGNPTRTYNGTTTANLGPGEVTVTGLQGSDSLTIDQSAGASYASANASTSDLVTANLQPSDFTLGGGTSLSNYTYSSTITGNGTITPIQLNYSLVGNPTKTYDGTTAATLNASNFLLNGFLAGQGATVNQTVGNYDNPNAGQRGVSANLTTANFDPFGGTILGNYVLPTLVAGLGTIVPAPIQGTIYAAIDGPTKVYDGTTVATLGTSNYVLTGFAGSDGATVNQTVGTFGSKNVGIQSVTAVLTDANFAATGSTDLHNYTLPGMAFGTGEITPRQLTASIIGNPTKVYNGTTYVTLVPSNYQLLGLVAGESADIVPSSEINFATRNVGTQLITAAMVSSSFSPAGGTLLSNYILPTQATGNGTITQAPLFVIGVSARNKSYDTTLGALLDSAGSSLIGIAAGDEGHVSLTRGTTGVFSQANVGNGLTVTPMGFGITGTETGNYSLQPIGSLTANITPAHLSISGVTAQAKIYDGSTVATLNDGAALLNGVFASDAAAVNLDTAGATGSTRSANVGNGLAVTTAGFALGGAQSGNYVLDPLNGLTMDITPRALTATITGNPSKPYDGSNSVTLTAADYTLAGFVAGQGASVPQSATAQYDSSNAGTHIGLQSTLVVSDFVATAGTNLANYILPAAATGTLGVITPFIINLQGQRVYDATTSADSSLFAPGGTVAGVNGETLMLAGSGVLSSKNVGSQRAFANTGTLTLGDNASALASNYTLVGGTDWVTITPAMLSVINTVAADKVYDANRNAALSGSVLNGVLGSDAVNLQNAAVGLFNTKNVGTGKTVTTLMTVNGSDAGNYVLVQPANVKADITALGIAVDATGVSRVYNGTTSSGATLGSAGVLSGDSVTFTSTSNTFDTKDVGTGKTVTVTGIGKTGTDAGNYILLNNSDTTTANITPFVINLQGTRVYDADTDAAAALFGTSGVVNGVAGESLTVSGTGVLGNKNVGAQKPFVSLGDMALAGNGGALSSNYTLTGGIDWVTVTKANLTVSGTTTTNKTYDGNASDVLSGSVLNGVLGTDSVALQNATAGTFDTKNVGTGKTVTTAMTVNGTDAGNYNIIQPTNLQADITALAITVQATGKNKVYDATNASAATLSSTGVVGGDQVTFTQASNTFDDKHAGTGKTVTVSGIASAGADAANYTLNNSVATTTATITPFVINLTGSRVYDATTDADAVLFGVGGQITGLSGESLTLSGVGQVGSKNVGNNQKFANGNPGSLGSLALAGNGATNAGDYTLTGGVDRLSITPFNVTVAANGSNKVYDGNAAAGVTLTPTGLFGGDVVNFSDGAANYSDKNVAGGKAITVTGITAGGADAGNYSFNSTATTTGDITPLAITGSILASNKVYDALTGAVTSGTLAGFVAGDQLSFNTSGSFSDKNVANGKTVNVTGSLGGLDAGNYTLTSNTATAANITPLTINVTATGPNKVYDGTTAETATLASAGVIVGDAVTFTDGSVAFSDKNVGNGKTVTVTGIAAGGADAGNYFYNTTTTTLADITPLTITGGIVAGNKTYDGTASAVTSGALTGVISGDVLTYGTTGTFGDKNVGNGKIVSVTGTLGGSDAGNYTLVDNTTTTADITPLAITVSATAPDKIYDGTTGESALLASTGVLGGDSVSFGDTSVAFSDKNVGFGKTVAVNGITASGTDAGNYSFNHSTTTTASITPLAIAGTIIASDKTYDGSTTAVTSGALSGVIAGDQLGFSTSGTFIDKDAGTGKTVNVVGALTGNDAGNYVITGNTTTTASIHRVVLDLTGTRVYDGTAGADGRIFGNAGVIAGIAGETLVLSGSGLLPDKNVATDELLTSQGSLALTGNGSASAGNYTLTGGRDTVTVTPLTINASIAAHDKVYDGRTDTTTDGTLAGVIAGDALTLTTSGRFVDKNAGNGKTVNVEGSLHGADAGNYRFVGNTTTTANITPLGIVVGATGTNRYFDGSVDDIVSLRSAGVLSGDSIVFGDGSATFADAAAGNGKTVTVQGIFATGADAGNYTFGTTALTQADILPLGTQGAPTIAAAQLGSLLQPMRIATPFGTAASNTVGDYSGNHKLTRQPVEANAQRADFYPGLALRVEDGGVKRPADAMH